MIIISINKQMLYHHRKTGVCYAYPVSTASRGAGNCDGSLQTPLGKHRIVEMIGAEMPIFTAFKGRQPYCIYDPITDKPDHDWILTRIIRLSGCETGKNRRGKVDTQSRLIYIHGTHEEEKIGSPASHGCIRMKNNDITALFEHVTVGERVRICE
ncbi:MAG: L,D-transpeptidase [Mariprofundus sp.]|nr:L,D-transpeptidase [Mariprofundus sp.]